MEGGMDSYTPTPEDMEKAEQAMSYTEQAQTEVREAAMGPENLSDKDIELLKEGKINLTFSNDSIRGILLGSEVALEKDEGSAYLNGYKGTIDGRELSQEEANRLAGYLMRFKNLQNQEGALADKQNQAIENRAKELVDAEAKKRFFGELGINL